MPFKLTHYLRQKMAANTGADTRSTPPLDSPTGEDATASELDRRLERLRSDDIGDEIERLADSAFNDLSGTFDATLSPHQVAAVDRTTRSLERIRESAGELRQAVDSSDFNLSELIQDVIRLCAATACDHGLDICALVYEDLPTRWQGKPHRLRGLLYRLGIEALEQMADGTLIIRAMTSASTNPDGDSATLRFTLSAECPHPHTANCAATRCFDEPGTPPSALPAARIGTQPGCQQLWLELSLKPAQASRGINYPAPWGGRRVLVHHPCATARDALLHRLRRMRYEAVELIADADGEAKAGASELAAALLATPPRPPSTATELLQALPVDLPVVLLSDVAPAVALPVTVTLLPRHADDSQLYRALAHAVHQHALSHPPRSRAPDDARALVGDNPALAESLHQRFVAELGPAVIQLRTMAAENRHQQLEDAVHKLKGGAAYAGVPALRYALVRLDESLRTGGGEQRIAFFLQRVEAEAKILQNNPLNSGAPSDAPS